jgi:hypothetical protein
MRRHDADGWRRAQAIAVRSSELLSVPVGTPACVSTAEGAITKHGEPVAKLIPVGADSASR